MYNDSINRRLFFKKKNFIFSCDIGKRYYGDDEGELAESCKIKRAVPQTTIIILLLLCL